MYESFRRVSGLGYMTVSEMLGSNAGEDLFDIFPEFSKVVHILVVIPATSRCSAERSLGSFGNDDGGDEVLRKNVFIFYPRMSQLCKSVPEYACQSKNLHRLNMHR